MRDRWIRVHARLIDRPLVAKLATALKSDPYKVMGHLITFWGSASANAGNGRVGDLPDELLERWSGWTGKRGAFAGALRAHHIDEDGRVKEWDDYQGTLETRRAIDRDRQRKWRERNADVTRDTLRDNGVRSRATNGVTERNGTERKKEQVQDQDLSPGAAVADPAAWLSPFVDIWTAKVGPVPASRAAKSLAPVRALYGDDRTLVGLRAYLDEPRHPDKPVKLEYFAQDAARWIAEGETPLVVDGVLTERGARMR